MPKRLMVVVAMAALCAFALANTSMVVAQGAKSLADGVYTEAQAARGQAYYLKNCSSCHGANLSGSGEVPALVGGKFIAEWTGLTLADLFERVHTTMPQDNPGSLTREQYADIVAFLLKQNGYPSGRTEVQDHSKDLKGIAFVPPPAGGSASASK